MRSLDALASASLLGLALATVASTGTAEATTLYGLTQPGNGQFLVRFESSAAGTFTAAAAITGLGTNEILEGIDFRPRTGQLFGLGVTPGGVNDQVRVYRIAPLTGVATQVGSSPLSIASAAGASYGFDFNPTVDRLRVFNSSNTNLRVNPNNGALAGADMAINPGGSTLVGAAYDRNFDGRLGTAGTTLYGIALNGGAPNLVTVGGVNQAPSPNTGTVFNIGSIGVFGALPQATGFDIDVDGGLFASFVVPAGGSFQVLRQVDKTTGAGTDLGAIGGGRILLDGLAAAPRSQLLVGSDSGRQAFASTFDTFPLTRIANDAPFEGAGGARVALADVTRDSVPDSLFGSGPGFPPQVTVVDPRTATRQTLTSLLPAAFTGGVFVAGGDVDGDGFRDLIVASGGAPRPLVRVYDGETLLSGSPVMLRNFLALPVNVQGGVRVAAADFDNDGDDEIVIGAGPGGLARVRVLTNAGAPAPLPGVLGNFLPYGSDFRGGVYVAAGDVNGDGTPDVVVGAGPGGLPQVRAFSGKDGSELSSFLAYEPTFGGGVRVAVSDVNGDGRYEIVTSPGPGHAATVRAFDATANTEVSSLALGGGRFAAGVYVAGVRR